VLGLIQIIVIMYLGFVWCI